MAGEFKESILSGEIDVDIYNGRTKTRIFYGPYNDLENDLKVLPSDSIVIGALHPENEDLKIVNIHIVPVNVVDGATHGKATIKYIRASSVRDVEDGFDAVENIPNEGDIGFQSTSLNVSVVTQHPDFDLSDPQLDVPEELTAYFMNLSQNIHYVLKDMQSFNYNYLLAKSCHVNSGYWGTWSNATWLFTGPSISRNKKGNVDVSLEFLASFGIDGDINDPDSKTIRNWNKNQLNDGTDYILYNTTSFVKLMSPAILGINLAGLWS